MRTLDEFRGNLANFIRAAKRSSGPQDGSFATDFNCSRFKANFSAIARLFLFLSIELFFAILYLSQA
jgi:hypothetical protein|tara:strand:- start:3516 stop:3716 length:201 start_codon:yes stop_codon:yes gene_type:complete